MKTIYKNNRTYGNYPYICRKEYTLKKTEIILSILALIIAGSLQAQEIEPDEIWRDIEKTVIDLDNDQINDTVYFDYKESAIICKLSSQNFEPIKSIPIEITNFNMGVSETSDGFSFDNHWMRAGYDNYFRYEPETKRIRLIYMSQYAFGNAANDGSGEASLDLLTGEYVGNWNYYDWEKDSLVAIPTIKTIMSFPAVYLEDFGEETYFEFDSKGTEPYSILKARMLRQNNYIPVPKDFFNPDSYHKTQICDSIFTFNNWNSLYWSYLMGENLYDEARQLFIDGITFNKNDKSLFGFSINWSEHSQWVTYRLDAENQLLYLRLGDNRYSSFDLQELVYKLEYSRIDPLKLEYDGQEEEALILHECVGATWDMSVEDILKCETFIFEMFGRSEW
ncbi:MAG: hypothetical protein LBI82_09095 [Dysgonamonadaceae bacterium]|nr:hypothetical protein [Dysgonamonadaceae bacterium]